MKLIPIPTSRDSRAVASTLAELTDLPLVRALITFAINPREQVELTAIADRRHVLLRLSEMLCDDSDTAKRDGLHAAIQAFATALPELCRTHVIPSTVIINLITCLIHIQPDIDNIQEKLKLVRLQIQCLNHCFDKAPSASLPSELVALEQLTEKRDIERIYELSQLDAISNPLVSDTKAMQAQRSAILRRVDLSSLLYLDTLFHTLAVFTRMIQQGIVHAQVDVVELWLSKSCETAIRVLDTCVLFRFRTPLGNRDTELLPFLNALSDGIVFFNAQAPDRHAPLVSHMLSRLFVLIEKATRIPTDPDHPMTKVHATFWLRFFENLSQSLVKVMPVILNSQTNQEHIVSVLPRLIAMRTQLTTLAQAADTPIDEARLTTLTQLEAILKQRESQVLGTELGWLAVLDEELAKQPEVPDSKPKTFSVKETDELIVRSATKANTIAVAGASAMDTASPGVPDDLPIRFIASPSESPTRKRRRGADEPQGDAKRHPRGLDDPHHNRRPLSAELIIAAAGPLITSRVSLNTPGTDDRPNSAGTTSRPESTLLATWP